jgi:uncharacterized protein (TIGR02271 family)
MDETAEYRSTVVSAFENRPQADTAVSELCRAGFREDQIRVEEARYYGESESDRTVVTVKADGRYDEATTILRRHGAFDLHTAAHAPRIAEGAERIQLREEELQVHKQLVETGKVRVRKEVVTEHRTIEVPVQREEIVIERHAPNGAPVPDSDIGPGEEIHIPVRREQVFVEKRPVVKEEVTVGKRVVQDTEHVGGEVRKEEVRIERVACEGDGDVHISAPQGTTTAPGSAPARADTGAMAAPTAERTERAQFRADQAASGKGPNAVGKEGEEAMILHRAYLKWLDEGCPDGQELRHYFEAAQEVRA